jgi:hypothetical protein
MTDQATTKFRRPINAFVGRGSQAEESFRTAAGMPSAAATRGTPDVIAPGIRPTPDHDLVFFGGRTIQKLTFTNFYVGGSQSWQPADIRNIDSALNAAMTDKHLNNVMAQYFAQKPTTTFQPSRILPGSNPAAFSQGDVEKLLSDLHNQGALAGFDLGSTVFNFMLPRGTVLNTNTKTTSETTGEATRGMNPSQIMVEDAEDSLHGLGGYHGSIHFPEGSGTGTLYYAVGAYSEMYTRGRMNGIPVFAEPWKNVVGTFYHELNEARTDPDVADAILAGDDPSAEKFLGWVSQQGEECGDFPVSEADSLTQVFQEVPLANGSGTVPVQFQYSNAAHGPEGPISRAHRRKHPPLAGSGR